MNSDGKTQTRRNVKQKYLTIIITIIREVTVANFPSKGNT